MSKNCKKIFFPIVFLFVFFLITAPVFAEDAIGGTVTGGQQGITIPNPLGSNSIIAIINNIINYLIYISIPLLAFFILLGGFQILSARGNPANVTKGGKTIAYALGGFAIILISKGVALVLLEILGA
ncbi:MAG: hypothetical protein NTW60_00935 [Candidatus Wolfebacteria bacterium]|nr:hypothetical protein [Candidatus Wolfebacteria bacterium]